MSVRLTKVNDYKNLLDDYDTWLFDCDGVLWHDDQVIDGVIEVLGILRRQGEHLLNSRPHFVLKKAGKKIIFVTNNATKSRKAYKAKFDKLG
jgi:4-nitrophenyl phosphatase